MDPKNMKELKELIKLMKDEGLSELKYEQGDMKIGLAMPTAGAIPQMYSPPPFSMNPESTGQRGPLPEKEKSSEKFHEIRSPFVGTFYRSPAPGEPDYVKQGDKISVGKVLCILEAMKIMNEIESDVSGELLEVCVENESLVEFGQLLFKIRKS